MKKTICWIGLITNFCFLLIWCVFIFGFQLLSDFIITYAVWIKYINILLLIASLIIGTFVLELDIDCLLKKIEIQGITQFEKLVFLSAGAIASCLFLYSIIYVFQFNLLGISMTQIDGMRYIEVPLLSIANIIMCVACILAFEYFKEFDI